MRDTLKAANKLSVSEYRHENGDYKPIDRQGLIAEFHRYKEGDHAFMNEEAPAYPHNPVVAKLATSHTTDFFQKYLA